MPKIRLSALSIARNIILGLTTISSLAGNGVITPNLSENNNPETSIIEALERKQVSNITATVAKSDCKCFGTNDGQILFSNAQGGSGSYEYSITGTTWSTNSGFLSVPAGTYQAYIRDANNPSEITLVNLNIEVQQPDKIAAEVSSTDVSGCHGNTNGSISVINATGGSGFYEYTLNGGVNWNKSTQFTGLYPGAYNVRVRDEKNPYCYITLNGGLVTISQPEELSASITKTNVTGCLGSNNGSIIITEVRGGSGTYQYSHDGGTTWQGYQNTFTFKNLGRGVYHVKIRDANFTVCSITLYPALQILGPAELQTTVSSTNATECSGGNGSITFSGSSGGSGNYSYSIDGGQTWEGNETFYTINNIAAGTYNIMMRDASNPSCIKTLNNQLIISNGEGSSSNLTAVVSSFDVSSCYGNADGSIEIQNISGGNGAYNFSIDNGTTWHNNSNFNNLVAGQYDVKIKETSNANCSVFLRKVIILQPDSLHGSASATIIECFGASTGTISITSLSGGSGSYEFSIDSGITWTLDSSYNSLTAGNYNIRIRDAFHPICQKTLDNNLPILSNPQLSAHYEKSDVAGCSYDQNGGIEIKNETGGSGSYEYSIDKTSWLTSPIFTNLPKGTYEISIRDNAYPYCTKTIAENVIIYAPASLAATILTTPACDEISNGTASISISGGTGSYNLSFIPAMSVPDPYHLMGLNQGDYFVQFIDGNNCTHDTSFTITLENCSPVQIQNFPTLFCNDTVFRFSYILNQSFNENNQMIFQLSDAAGSFTNPHSFDSVTSNTSGDHTLLFKMIPAGNSYRIRAICTSPYAIGADNGQDIRIKSFAKSPINIQGPLEVCNQYTHNFVYSPAAEYYHWSDANGSSLGSGNYLQVPFTEPEKTFMVQGFNLCGASEAVSFTVKNIVSFEIPTISVDGIILHSTPAINYQWYLDQVEIPGATSQSITALRTGTYKVRINNDLCPGEDSVFFNGITQDLSSDMLNAPAIRNATYQWYHEENLIVDATTNNYSPGPEGTYKVVISFDNSQKRVVEVVQAIYSFEYIGKITSVEYNEALNFIITNHGDNNSIEVSSNLNLGESEITILSLHGVEVYAYSNNLSTKSHVIDVSQFSKGIYLLRIQKENKVFATKIIVY